MTMRPTPEQMYLAAEWLLINEGEEGESEACAIVADWLEKQVDAQLDRQIARENGVPVAVLRKAINA